MVAFGLTVAFQVAAAITMVAAALAPVGLGPRSRAALAPGTADQSRPFPADGQRDDASAMAA